MTLYIFKNSLLENLFNDVTGFQKPDSGYMNFEKRGLSYDNMNIFNAFIYLRLITLL